MLARRIRLHCTIFPEDVQGYCKIFRVTQFGVAKGGMMSINSLLHVMDDEISVNPVSPNK